MPRLPGTRFSSSGDSRSAHASNIKGVPPDYLSIHTGQPCTQLFNHDEYTESCKRAIDFIPDLLTADETSTGWYTVCCVVTKLTSI